MHTSASSSGKIRFRQKIQQLFLSHPASVGESYLAHQRACFRFGLLLIWTALAAMLHGIVPALCQHTASARIALLHKLLQSRSNKAQQ